MNFNSKFYFLLSIFSVVILLSTFYFLFSMTAFAAEIFYDADTRKVKANTEFEVGVFLNAESENINAIEGILRFPADILEFKELNDGNSIVNFWVERPKLYTENEIIFSGITPGGFVDKRGLIFRITFLAKNEGNGKLEMQNIKALLNDGNGTAADISVSPLKIIVTSQDLSLPPKKEAKDQEPPESFKPEIARDPAIFDGKWFLVFATQDKGLGIGHYKVREGRGGGFTVAESPYLLQNQNLDRKIFVKVVDKEGNERVETLYPPNYKSRYQNYWIIAILIITAIIVGAILRKILWKKSAKAR